jgi:L,D-transpeptidase catalytic domain
MPRPRPRHLLLGVAAALAAGPATASASGPAAEILRVREDATVRLHSRPGGRTIAIVNKLRGRPFGRTYGCCVIALSARQPKVRSGGFDGRMAIHGTARPDLIGGRGSLGCLRTTDTMLRRLARRVPVGTPVVITR